MDKKTWHIRLSLISFGYVYSITAHEIFFARKDFNLYLKLLGQFFISLILYVFLPTGVMLFIMDRAMKYNEVIGTIINFIILAYVYFIGVYISYRLIKWKQFYYK